MPENIGFISTRFSGTDGVSLESAKWAEVLWEDRHISYWYAGQLDRAPEISMCIPEAYFHHPENDWINQQLWGRTHRTPKVSSRIRDLAEYLKGTLYGFIERYDITVLIVENALTIPMHIPLGIAITEFLAETEIPTIAHHHDFYWERDRFQISAVQDYLEMAFPPRSVHVQHAVINQAARETLSWRKGVSALLVPNVLDFHNPPPSTDGYSADIRKQIGIGEDDRLILQPTRIVPRKGIEHTISLLRRLRDPKNKLVFSHKAGDEGMDYFNQLQQLAKDEKVDLKVFGDRVEDLRRMDAKGNKIYTLHDIYPHADLVTFPSLYEGFGNAFLEGIYFKVPMMVNKYSVYLRDIEPKGFRLPAMEGFVNQGVIEEVRRIFDDPDYRHELVNHNYAIAKKYYSYPVLRACLQTLLSNIKNRVYG